MLNFIDVMKYDRSIFLCIFQEGYLTNLLKTNNYNPKVIKVVIDYMEQFIRVSYCPKKYIDMVMDQLIKLYDMDDEYKQERNKVINDAITRRYTLNIKDEYYREQVMYYIGQMANDIVFNPTFDIDFKRNARNICSTYVKVIGTISKNEDSENVLKKNYINGLCYDLVDLCMDNENYCEVLAKYLSKFVGQVESVENINGFTHYNSYLRIRDINGIVNEDNFDDAIKVLVSDTCVELDILSTHTDPKYIENEHENMQELCDNEGYYRCLNALIRNNEKLLKNEQFVTTIRAITKLASKTSIEEILGENIEKIKGR